MVVADEAEHLMGGVGVRCGRCHEGFLERSTFISRNVSL